MYMYTVHVYVCLVTEARQGLSLSLKLLLLLNSLLLSPLAKGGGWKCKVWLAKKNIVMPSNYNFE